MFPHHNSLLCVLLLAVVRPSSSLKINRTQDLTENSTINNPGPLSVHENDDDAYIVWNNIDAMCFVTYDCSYTCLGLNETCSDCDPSPVSSNSTCVKTCSNFTSCDECVVTEGGALFEVVNGTIVQKNECEDRGCEPCSASGCVNAGESYTVNVTCRDTWRTFINNGEVSTTFQVNITANAPPVIDFSEGTSIEVSQNRSVGDVINRIIYNDSDSDVGNEYIRYKLNSGPEPSYIHQNTLFNLNEANGEIIITHNLEKEFSNNYTMVLCISDRRSDDVCKTLNIGLVACYQTPNCSDHELNIIDTFGISDHSSTDSLYTVTSPDPSEHFTDFRTTWAQLSWNYVENELETETSLNESTGEIIVVQNISIHPAWPSKTFKQVINVSNSESCYVTSCTLTITVNYTNWPIEIHNLPSYNNVSEDEEGDVDVHVLDIYDYNYDSEDNVTCEMTNIFPYEANLFELRNDSLFTRTSYKLTKLACQTPGCGYKNESYLCNQNIGCLNYDNISQYEVTIRCWDAYGSEDQGVFTLYVVENEAPQYVNLPTTVILDTSVVASLETVFSIAYTDNENESMIYEYIFADIDEPYDDPHYFIGSPTGTVSDSFANITTTVYLHDKPVNKTYFIQICGHERRNEICANLTVKLQEYCSPTPDCADNTITINETEPDNVLFDVAQLVKEASNYTSSQLSYTIASMYPDTFRVDESTGIVTKNGVLETVYPSTTYTLNAFVSEPDTCSYGHCLLTVIVKYVNEPIDITNLPENVSIHEDDTPIDTLIAIETSDANVDDTVACFIENSVEPFYITETISGSQEYLIKKRENAVLSSATTTYIVTVNCSDAHGSSDTGILTITVELNQSPALANLQNTTSITVNPYDYSEGDSVYTVSATDPENDELTFNCSIQNSMVPLTCRSTVPGSTTVDVELRRNVDGVEENGLSYSIDICVSDPKQYEYPCGSLNVTFTSDKTRPEIINLPDTLSFPENTTVGTVLFSANVSDPDVGETHTFSMTVISRDGQSIFNLDSNGDLLLLNNFDYENITDYQLSISVRDDYLEGIEAKVLTINVVNVNEPNTLEASTTAITFQETTEVNSVLEDPGLTCADEDGGDTLTYSIQAVYDHFSINSNIRKLTLTKLWDLESDPVLPTSAKIIITCTDAGGLSSSVAVVVNIEAVNEYPPQIQVLSGDQAIQVNSTTNPATTFLTFQAFDEDYDDDGVFECSIVGIGLGSRYFRIVQTTDTSGVSVFSLRPTGYFFFNNNKKFQFTIRCCDGEEFPLCSSLTVNVTYTTRNPDVGKTKPEKKCLLCHSNGKALVACVAIECLIIIGFIAHCCTRMVCSTNKTKGQIDLIKHHLSRSRHEPSSSHSRAHDGRTAANVRINRRRPGSEKSLASARGIMLTPINTIPRPDNHSIDLSSGSSDDDSNYDTTEFRKRTQSASSRLSVFATNKVQPSKTRNRTSTNGNRESNLNEGVPGRMFRAKVSAPDTGLPLPFYSSEVNAVQDGNTLDY